MFQASLQEIPEIISTFPYWKLFGLLISNSFLKSTSYAFVKV